MQSSIITDTSNKRRYDDACAAAHALDLIGERWALLVIRELMFGPKRFSDLRASLPGLSANVLTQRLEGLEAASVLVRRRLPPPAAAWVYELTPWGYEIEPVFQALGRWAVRSPLHDPTRPISISSIMLSFRAMLDRDRARGLHARIGFRFGTEEFMGVMDDEGLTIRREAIADADAVFSGSHRLLAAFVYGGMTLEEAEAAGLSITGNRELARHFATLFPLPDHAPDLTG